MSAHKEGPHAHVRRIMTSLLVGILLSVPPIAVSASDIESQERILETARSFLTDFLQTDGHSETRIEIGKLDSRLRLARCTQPPTAQLPPGARADRLSTVNIRCSQPVQWSIFVPVRVERYTEVVVVARPLSSGRIIRASDLRLERVDASKLANGYFDHLAAVTGLQTRRALRPGQVLIGSHVAPRVIIKRGQQVTIFSSRPGLSVRMKGEALEDGTEGQRIRVRNRSSKRIVEGYVEASGAVRIAF